MKNITDIKTFATNLKKVRIDRKMKGSYAAYHIGIEHSLLQKYESPTRCPDIGFTNLVKILKFYNITFETLLPDMLKK
jgi:DNA-binding Xre family transcriptional regulator